VCSAPRLEIGCASGSFLERMSRRGWQVEGIEFSKEAASYCASRGYRVHGGPLESAPDPGAPFDLITGWMVLEHLHEPLGRLKKLASWTQPGGRLAISVPNAGCLGHRMFGDAWFPLHLSNHLFHFTRRTLAQMLRAGGWEVERIFCQPNVSEFVGSAGFVLQDRGVWDGVAKPMASFPWWSGRLNLALLPLSYPLSLMGQTGRMTAWAILSRDGNGAVLRGARANAS
jgi:SAM-dependent methyltransferase